MKINIDFPFAAEFTVTDPGNNSRELRTQSLQIYLGGCGMELRGAIEDFVVKEFRPQDDGEFWVVSNSPR